MKIKSLLTASLAAIALSSCTPNLSTPEDTVKTFLSEIKKGKDPLNVCGYREEIKGLEPTYLYLADASRDNHANSNRRQYCGNDAKCYQSRYGEFTECLPDIEKCIISNDVAIAYSGNPRYKNFTRLIGIESEDHSLNINLQKESDGKWYINGLIGPKPR